MRRKIYHPLADWLIKQFLRVLKKKIIKIRIVRKLRDPYTQCKVLGLCVKKDKSQEIYIYIEIQQKLSEKVLTAIHELGHATWWYASETEIRKFESLMWRYSSTKMKLKFLEALRKKTRLGRQPK